MANPDGTRNVLFVLRNGDPEEWAILRNVPADWDGDDQVKVYRFNDVPAELAQEIEDSHKPKAFWDELLETPHDTL